MKKTDKEAVLSVVEGAIDVEFGKNKVDLQGEKKTSRGEFPSCQDLWNFSMALFFVFGGNERTMDVEWDFKKYKKK